MIAMVMAGLFFSGGTLSRVQSRVIVLEKVTKLLDTVLEIRRYEKNWILYGLEDDLAINHTMVANAFALIEELDGSDNLGKETYKKLKNIKMILGEYEDLMEREAELLHAGKSHKMLETIREKGKYLVDLADDLNDSTRSSINSTLSSVHASGVLLLLIFTLTAMFFARNLATSVVRPLRQIVHCTGKIASGETAPCTDFAEVVNLAEIKAVMQAIQYMLHKIENREELIIQKEKLAAVGTLVAGVAHELNNPLSNAGTSAEILLEEMRENEDVPRKFQLEMLEQITEQTDRARTIVRSLLEFSREREVRPEQLLVSDVLHQTMDLVRGEIPTNVETRLLISEDVFFWADKQRLQQGLVNLLLNAFHALGDFGRIELCGGFDDDTGKVKIEVRDNGPGIPDEIVNKIFDPFFTTKDVGEGSGLGLAVTREIITKHGGEIKVSCPDEGGTVFTIMLPVEKSGFLEQSNGKS
ncbi:MAG: ATP-binding protein [Desulfobulbaceae bacterium]|nr:ATP-binding protein [Desulfobulbaceae bacterium]HIJ78327.1 hypothetical protein [Deltaproteobacteria bacterium]